MSAAIAGASVWTSAAPGTPGFDIDSYCVDLPEDVKGMRTQNMVELSTNYFDDSIGKVHRFIENDAAAGKLDVLTSFGGKLPVEDGGAAAE